MFISHVYFKDPYVKQETGKLLKSLTQGIQEFAGLTHKKVFATDKV